MIKMIATDLDRTLAPLNGSAFDCVRDSLRHFESLGIRIAIASGKPTEYLAGFARQLGLENALIIGENGCTLREGHSYPPALHMQVPIEPEYFQTIKQITSRLLQDFSEHIWIQPNEVQMTVFWRIHDTEFIERIIRNIESELDQVPNRHIYQCFRSTDCYDVLPSSASKGNALMEYCNIHNICLNDLITIGDNHNDASMFEITQNSIQIGKIEGLNATWQFNTMQEAMTWIEEHWINQ